MLAYANRHDIKSFYTLNPSWACRTLQAERFVCRKAPWRVLCPKMTKVTEAIKEYLIAVNQLEKLGVVRTQGEIIGDYGEWLASKKFGLKLAKSLVNKDYDAADSHGKTYQIKTRVVKSRNSATSFDFRNDLGEFDYLVVVLLGEETLEPLFITKIPRQFVKTHIYKNKDNYRFRWNKKITELISGQAKSFKKQWL